MCNKAAMCVMFAAWGIGLSAANAATTGPSDTQAHVSALVNDLTSDDFGRRQSAQRELVAMGADIEPQLRDILKGNLSDEARARLQSAVQQIDENGLVGSSIITMHYTNAPLQDVLDDFAAQAGADLGVDRPIITEYAKSRLATVDLDHADFWHAMRQVMDTSGLSPQPYRGDRRMTLEPGAAALAAFDVFGDAARTVGPALIFPQSSQQNRMVDYGHGQGVQSNLSLQLGMVLEPKLRMVGQPDSDWLLQCVDDRGHSLLPPRKQTGFYSPSRRWWWLLSANLREVPDMGRKIALLRGELKFSVQTKFETMEVDDLSKLRDVKRTIDSSVFSVESLDHEDGLYRLRLSMDRPWPFDRLREIAASIQILDAQNSPYVTGEPSSRSEQGAFTMDIPFTNGQAMNGPGLGPPAKLRWETGTQTRHLVLPFEMKNLELPHGP